MTKPKPTIDKNVFDNEYDNDAWSEKEISLSSKVLVALGGITSLGGMIPLLIQKLTQAHDGFVVGPSFFVIFTVVYFTLPLIVLIVWSYFTNRIVQPSDIKLKTKENFFTRVRNFKSMPVTYRYKWLIWIQIFFIIIYLIISVWCTWVYTLLLAALLLLISPLIAVRTFTNRDYRPKKLSKSLIKVMSFVLLTVFVITTLLVYTRDIEKNLVLVSDTNEHDMCWSEDKTDVNKQSKHLTNKDYEKIAYVEETSTYLSHIEDDLVNEVDRFHILSGMNAWNILSQKMTDFEDSVDLSAFKIDSSISILNTYLIDDKDSALPFQKDDFIRNLLKKYLDKAVVEAQEQKQKNDLKDKGNNKKNGKVKEGKKKIKFFITHNPFCKKHFDKNPKDSIVPRTADTSLRFGSAVLGDYFYQLFLATQEDSVIRSSAKPKNDVEYFALKINFKMGMVNGHIDKMLSREMHRLYPSCFSHLIIIPEPEKSGENGKSKDQNLDTSVAQYSKIEFGNDSITGDSLDPSTYPGKYLNPNYRENFIYDKLILKGDTQPKVLFAIRLDHQLRTKLAATMNRYNSRVFKDWLEGMYLPYAQRKSGQEMQQIAKETEWIWKEIKYMGIIVSITVLFLLSLQYLELLDLKNYIINSKILPPNNTFSAEEKESAKAKISDLNQKATYLLFPLTTTLTIVAVLLIPVTTKTELVNIEPTKSFRMLQVPSLNLPEVVKSSVNIEYEQKRELEMQKLHTEIQKLTIEIERLSIALNNVTANVDSVAIHKELKDLKESIIRLNTKYERINSNTDQLNTKMDKSKRR